MIFLFQGYHGCCKTRGMRNNEMCCGGTLVDNAYWSCCTDRYLLDLYEYGKLPEGNMPLGKPFHLRFHYCCVMSQGHVQILDWNFQEHCLLLKT